MNDDERRRVANEDVHHALPTNTTSMRRPSSPAPLPALPKPCKNANRDSLHHQPVYARTCLARLSERVLVRVVIISGDKSQPGAAMLNGEAKAIVHAWQEYQQDTKSERKKKRGCGLQKTRSKNSLPKFQSMDRRGQLVRQG